MLIALYYTYHCAFRFPGSLKGKSELSNFLAQRTYTTLRMEIYTFLL